MSCPMYDELHECCAFERMETVYPRQYRDDSPAWNYDECFEEFD
jgi:hypothetical protein